MKQTNKKSDVVSKALSETLAEFQKNLAEHRAVSQKIDELAAALVDSLVKAGCYGTYSRPRKYGITSLAQLVDSDNVNKLTTPYSKKQGGTFYNSLQQFSKANSFKYPNKQASIPEVIQGNAVLEFDDGYEMYLYYLSAEHQATFAAQLAAITEAQATRKKLSKAYMASFQQVEHVYLKMKQDLYPTSAEW